MYGQFLNDALPDETRQSLVSFIPRLLNTAGDGLDEQRSYLALDWMFRTNLPAWLRLVPALTAQGDLLAAAPEVVDRSTAATISVLVRQAASQANAAQAAVWVASPDAFWGATGASAWSAGAAVWNAAWVVARDAVQDASWVVARDAARVAAEVAAAAGAPAAAQTVLAPTVTALQDSAIDLFDRMLSVTK